MDVKEAGAAGTALWARLFRRVRRLVLGRRRLLAALCAAAAVLAALQVLRPPDHTVPVLVAARDLDAGVRLTTDDLRRVPMDPAVIPLGMLRAAAGRVLAGPVRAGEPITDARVVGPGLVPGPSEALVPVRLADPAVAGQLRVGQVVDVLAVGARGDAVELAAGARVAAVPRGGGPPTGDLSGRLVLLLIPRDERDTVVAAAVRDYVTVSLTR